MAAIHGYLCADGYVVSHKQGSRHKYYRMALRNTEIVLLKDFAFRFKNVFGILPKISPRIDRAYAQRKHVYLWLVKRFGSFHSYKWRFPELFRSRKLKSAWLRAVFDCESWVSCKKASDRHIGLEMVNRRGVLKIKKLLSEFKIRAKFKVRNKRGLYRLNIFGKQNIEIFSHKIGFLHPKKHAKLEEAIASYVDFRWHFPEKRMELKKFILTKLAGKSGKISSRRIRVCSCFRNNLKKLRSRLKTCFGVDSKVSKESVNGLGNTFFELSINKKSDVQKLALLAKS